MTTVEFNAALKKLGNDIAANNTQSDNKTTASSSASIFGAGFAKPDAETAAWTDGLSRVKSTEKPVEKPVEKPAEKTEEKSVGAAECKLPTGEELAARRRYSSIPTLEDWKNRPFKDIGHEMYDREYLLRVKEKGNIDDIILADKYLIRQNLDERDALNEELKNLDPEDPDYKEDKARIQKRLKEIAKENAMYKKELEKLKSVRGGDDTEDVDETEEVEEAKETTNAKPANQTNTAQNTNSDGTLPPAALKQIVAAVLEALGQTPAPEAAQATANAEAANEAGNAVKLDPETLKQIVGAVLAAMGQTPQAE